MEMLVVDIYDEVKKGKVVGCYICKDEKVANELVGHLDETSVEVSSPKEAFVRAPMVRDESFSVASVRGDLYREMLETKIIVYS